MPTIITYSNIRDLVTFYLSDKIKLPADLAQIPIGEWDVSGVTNMAALFKEYKDFNENIGNWDVSNVTDMAGMFFNCQNFNQDIGEWDVSSVTNMYGMLGECRQFNQDISEWDVSNVTNMRGMFYNCKKFNQDIGEWEVNNVTNMYGLFGNCRQFNKDISKWDVSNVTNMKGMFYNCTKFNQDIGKWDVSNVTNMDGMFTGCNIIESYKPKRGAVKEDEDYEEAPDDMPTEQTCFWGIGPYYISSAEYLKTPNQFIFKLPNSNNYECASLNDLKHSARIEGRQNVYNGFYECSQRIMDKVRNSGAVPLSFRPDDYIESVEYIRLGNATAFYVVKPDWLWTGPVPEPRKFELVKIGDEEKYFVSKSIAKGYERDVISGVHCDLHDKGYIYKLVPINAGGKRIKKKRKTLKKKRKTLKKKRKTLKKKRKTLKRNTLKRI
jgi:surface protein